jgi:conjugative relaxase-like TrwC/TraI family protein
MGLVIAVTVSIRRMSLGSGFCYLMGTVARGDGAAPTTALTQYYTESGTPPGRWLGAGLDGLDGGKGVAVGSLVTEEGLWRVLGMLADPVTGEPLGRRPQRWTESLTKRIGTRVAALPDTVSIDERARAIAQIEAIEQEREASLARPVAAFDLTFSVPKSASVVWALADTKTQAAIHQAHQDAIAVALEWAERNIVFTRVGAGGAIQEDVRGVVAAAFDHWDSRAGDPHLHTHVVVANRVQTADGVWRSLDSKTLHRYTVALSELHEGVVQDLLTERLGVGWIERSRRHSAVPRHDIDGVPTDLIDDFSSRSRDIGAAKDDLVADFREAHGRHPTNVEILKLRQQATLSTRPEKQHISLGQRMASWRSRARQRMGRDPTAWAASVMDQNILPALTSGSFEQAMLATVARTTLDAVAHKRATFGHANILAEAHRQLHGIRFASPHDRLAVAERVTTLALDEALPLDPPAPQPTAAALVRADGTSKLRHRGAARFTTAEILDAETRLLDAGRSLSAPALDDAQSNSSALRLDADQREAITSIATSGRTLDLLVGPAGAGKTTSLTALKTAWESAFGASSVIGLAPSAAAAQVLADELGIITDNTAKWLVEQPRNAQRIDRIDALTTAIDASSSPGTARARRLAAQRAIEQEELDRWSIRSGQLLIIDEASLAGTLALDNIVESARSVGAKVVLVGDWAQLGAIEAGGAFHMLANDRADTPELRTVRRFKEPWEAQASTRLRKGDAGAIGEYEAHGRIHSGVGIDAIHQLFDGWRADIDRGLDSIMIAPDEASVAALNLLAQARMRDTLEAKPNHAQIANGQLAAVGERIITRRNDRRLRVDHQENDRHDWVRNGDTWTITEIHSDGSLTAASVNLERAAWLPEDYVLDHVELGYALTTHRAQGRTEDSAHALITAGTNRESLYVAATRARSANDLYIDLSEVEDDPETAHDAVGERTAQQVLARTLQRSATAISAHAVGEIAVREHGSVLESVHDLASPIRVTTTPQAPEPERIRFT